MVFHPHALDAAWSIFDRVTIKGEPTTHVRAIIEHHGDYIASCSCGWFSVCYTTDYFARGVACPIEAEFAASAERRRRMEECK